MCKHETALLMGTKDGILCRGCGTLFHSFDEIKAGVGNVAEAPQNVKQKAPAKRSRKKEG
jgi:hypothetical protein